MWWSGGRGNCGAGVAGVQHLILSVILTLLVVTQNTVIALSSAQQSIYTISKTELDALIHSKDFTSIRNVLKYEGGFAVTDLGSEYSQAVTNLKSLAPSCLKGLRYPEFLLPDGSLRTTFAKDSADVTTTADYPPCLAQTSSVISRHFDSVYTSISNLFEELTGKESLTWKEESKEVKSFSDLPNKEHIHVYHGGVTTEEGYAAPFHTDNGILLLITPFQEHPLQVRKLGGGILDTSSLDDSSVLILIARALPEWLLRGSKESAGFRAAPHAVTSLAHNLKDRTVFARMMVAPLDAVSASPYSTKLTFDKIFFNQPITQGDLCLTGEEENSFQSRVPRDTGHEGHQGHQGHEKAGIKVNHANHHINKTDKSFEDLKKDECTDPTTAYCWMGCLDLPSCPGQDDYMCTNSAGRNCCTDPADEGTGNCADMDPSCTWKCDDKPPTTQRDSSHSTMKHTSQHKQPITSQVPTNDRFCIPGTGTDMYMDGFQISGQPDNPCVILFFKVWVLDSRVKFLFGCLGCILLGIGVEGLLCFRRLLQSRKILRVMTSPVRRVSIIVLFGFNIAAGYLAMLVAMTYSVELFICMVIGLVIGHAIFNTSAPVGESVDPCCASQVIGPSNDSLGSDSSHMPQDGEIDDNDDIQTVAILHA